MKISNNNNVKYLKNVIYTCISFRRKFTLKPAFFTRLPLPLQSPPWSGEGACKQRGFTKSINKKSLLEQHCYIHKKSSDVKNLIQSERV